MPPNSSSHQIYQCSSECSDHSRTSHSNVPHTHHHSHVPTHGGGSHHNGHGHSHGQTTPSGNDTMRSESSTENGGGKSNSQHRCHNKQRFPEIVENDHQLAQSSAGSCTYEVLGEPMRNCSECCSSSREGDTCSCSEGSCLYAEAGEPGMPPHMTTVGGVGGGAGLAPVVPAKLITQNN